MSPHISEPTFDGLELLEGVRLLSPPPHDCLKLLVGGDIAPIGAANPVLSGSGAGAFWTPLAEVVRERDIRVANLECALTHSHDAIAKAGPVLRADPACAEGIRAGGFDALTLANNHIFDMGPVGLADTLTACREAGIQTVGVGWNLEEACKPLILERSGIRLAIVAVAEREFTIAGRDSPGAAPVDPILNASQIRDARMRADAIVVTVHGGNEHYALPRPGLVRYCRFLVDCGAHAVICHHNHMASALEVYRGAPISYGLGNLVFDKAGKLPDSWYIGYLMSLDIGPSGVISFRIVPYEQFRSLPGLALLAKAESRHLAERLAALNGILASADALETEWRRFCRSRRVRYLLPLRAPFLVRGMAAFFRRMPKLLRVLLPESQRSEILAFIRCDSHREALETILEDWNGAETGRPTARSSMTQSSSGEVRPVCRP